MLHTWLCMGMTDSAKTGLNARLQGWTLLTRPKINLCYLETARERWIQGMYGYILSDILALMLHT